MQKKERFFNDEEQLDDGHPECFFPPSQEVPPMFPSCFCHKMLYVAPLLVDHHDLLSSVMIFLEALRLLLCH